MMSWVLLFRRDRCEINSAFTPFCVWTIGCFICQGSLIGSTFNIAFSSKLA